MDAEVTKFQQLWAEKSTAKSRVVSNLQQAQWNDLNNVKASAEWQAVEEEGAIEKAREAEAKALAAAYVESHGERFAVQRNKSLDACVHLVSAYRSQGLAEEVLITEMWILSQFDKQHIGGKGGPDHRVRN